MPERASFQATSLFRPGYLQRPVRLLLVIIFLFAVDTLPAQNNDKIVLLLSGESGAYRVFRERIEQLNLDSPKARHHLFFFDISHLDDEKIHQITRDASLVVTAGRKSTTAFSRLNSSIPHIATLLTREDYTLSLSLRPGKISNHCGVVIDQPLDRIISAINRELPDIKRIGIIEESGDNSIRPGSTDPSISGIRIIREEINSDIHATIKSLARNEADAIVALHNKAVYNRRTARNILISSYHFNIPVIGYSSAFVKAGSLIGIYSKPESLADETYNYIINPENCKNGRVIHPETYTIEFNPQVAKSLGINIPTYNLEKTFKKEARQ